MAPEAFELLTRCMLANGSREQAAAPRPSSASASQGLPMHGAFADRAAAAVALDAGDARLPPSARSHRPPPATEVGAPVEAALSRMLAGRALARR